MKRRGFLKMFGAAAVGVTTLPAAASGSGQDSAAKTSPDTPTFEDIDTGLYNVDGDGLKVATNPRPRPFGDCHMDCGHEHIGDELKLVAGGIREFKSTRS